MIVLGIESTAHTFGASILDTEKKGVNKVLSNIKHMATTEKGGMIPIKVAEHHEEYLQKTLYEALEKAKIKIAQVELIAVSNAPGLGHALRVGVAFARALAVRYNKPIIGVNHCIAHLEVGSLATTATDPVLLYCSGANTQIIAYDGGKYRIFGETLDTGIGNFLDTLARTMELGFPGGPKIEQLALACKNKNELLEIPYSVKGMDVAFSGILTNLDKKIASNKFTHEKIAYTTQEVTFAMLVEVAERALAHTGKIELVLGGGVACNKRLQEMCTLMCNERGIRCYIPPNELLVDNAAMIAWCGYKMFTRNTEKNYNGDNPISLMMKPYERTDDVDVYWR